MTNKGKNNCPYILTRGSNRVCGKSCHGEYCSVHMKLIRAREGRSIMYTNCSICKKLTRSRFKLCYICGVTFNARYNQEVKGKEIVGTGINIVQ